MQSGLRTTCQFNTKIFYPEDENKPFLWSSDPLSDVGFSEDKNNFYAENLAVELSEDSKTYTIKSLNNEKSIVNLTVSQSAPPFVVGRDGKSHFGTDPEAPWGSMRHAFWARNIVAGSIITEDGPIDFAGKGLFVHALQGMKPHHAAAKWNFIDFQGPTYSAVIMEYTTPPSYGSTVVSIGSILKDGEIITAGAQPTVIHTKIKGDPETEWPEAEDIKCEWAGKTKDEKAVEAVLEGPLGERKDRVDVMAQVPGFVKSIVAVAAGTRPFIYHVCLHSLFFILTID